jgi:hypothetical protein
MQIIPPFSLWWIAMVHDYSMWRDDPAFVSNSMPGVRAVIDAFRRWINPDGLVQGATGWNYMDWVQGWYAGIPPDGVHGVSSVLNLQMVLVLRMAAELEEAFGDIELAQRNRKLADGINKTVIEKFWDESRGMIADDLEKKHFSEHAQCLALIGGSIDGPKREKAIEGLLNAPDLARTTIYFTYYLFETYRMLGRIDRFFDRMGLWYDLKSQGFKTTLETPEPSRSDCHAWGAHPIFHYYASVLGIRPAAPGFASVRIDPQLGTLSHASGKLVHPKGFVTVDFAMESGKLTGTIELPEGVTGTLVCGGKSRTLKSGKQEI